MFPLMILPENHFICCQHIMSVSASEQQQRADKANNSADRFLGQLSFSMLTLKGSRESTHTVVVANCR